MTFQLTVRLAPECIGRPDIFVDGYRESDKNALVNFKYCRHATACVV